MYTYKFYIFSLHKMLLLTGIQWTKLETFDIWHSSEPEMFICLILIFPMPRSTYHAMQFKNIRLLPKNNPLKSLLYSQLWIKEATII